MATPLRISGMTLGSAVSVSDIQFALIANHLIFRVIRGEAYITEMAIMIPNRLCIVRFVDLDCHSCDLVLSFTDKSIQLFSTESIFVKFDRFLKGSTLICDLSKNC